MSFKLKRALLIAVVTGVAVLIAFGLSQMKPPPESDDIDEVELLVEVATLEAGDYEFTIESQGTVRPLTETILSAEVSGAIVSVSPKFVSGGVFAAGEELMRIDPTNYAGAVEQAEALLNQRQIEYDGAKSLRTQGYRAEAEYASAAAALATAKADLTRAQRDFERTRIRLPYDGMVRRRSADLGQYVNPGQELGVVFSTDYAEVRLPLVDQDLAFVDLPSAVTIAERGVQAEDGLPVTLSAVQRGRQVTWPATIVRGEGVVDERARVTYAVARIRDPYRLYGTEGGGMPLPMGTFVKAQIEGATLKNSVRLPRSALRRNNDVVFIDAENRIRIRPVTVARADAQFAYIFGADLAGERISLTSIEAPLNGLKVRTTDEEASSSEQKVASETAGE